MKQMPKHSESNHKPQYDVFVSYKSEDIHLVRRISEGLIANGFQVWFAEYEVLLQNYTQFQNAIDNGIQNSRYGVCFTNDRYVESKYCRNEIEQLLNRSKCGPVNLIEVMVPSEPRTRERYSELSNAPSIEHRFIDDTLSFLAKKMGRPFDCIESSVPSNPEKRQCFDNGREAYSLDVQGWDVSDKAYLKPSGGDLEGPKISRHCGEYFMWGNLMVGDQVDNPRAWNNYQDDRECYKYALEFAEHYFFKRRGWRFIERPIGLHLLFSHGFSHIGFTAKNWFNIWTRRYSVLVSHPQTEKTLEFAFIFFFRGPFDQFCRYAYLMDELVGSLVV